MRATISLPEQHQRTYEMVLEDPMSPTIIKWSAVRALLDEIAEVVEEPYGILRISRKGQSLVLHTPANGLEPASPELACIRQFIRQTQSAPRKVARSGEWLVVIDRHDASVFRSVAPGAVPQVIRSHHPANGGPPPVMTFLNGPLDPALPDFFEPLAGVLNGARRILIFGRETTLGGETERFIRWLRGSRPAVAERIVGAVPVEPHEHTEAGLVAKARDFYQRQRREGCRPGDGRLPAGGGMPA